MTPFPLAFCPDGYARLERLRLFTGRRAQDCIFAFMYPPSAVLREFRETHREGYCERPDLAGRAAFWARLLADRAAIYDDSIPSAYLTEMDQGLYGGIAGGAVQFMCNPENGWISSMVAPVLRDWSGFAGLRVDRDGEIYRYYLRALEVFRRAAAGKFAISHFILIDGFNFLFELFGASRAYVEAEDNPELVSEALEFAYRLNVEVQQVFFEQVDLLEGGTCSNFVGWLPGRVVSESVDPFHMTSVKFFERWGRCHVERILNTFDGGILHLHGNGRRLLEPVRTIQGLRAISALDDRGYPSAFSIVAELKRRAGDVPLMVNAEFGEFLAELDRHGLPGGVLYRVQNVPDVEAANRVMDRVREYRA